MNIRSLMSLTLVLLSSSMRAEIIMLDRIEAVVFGPEGADVITTTDIALPGIDGRIHALDDRILERKMYQDALRFKVVDADAVDRQLKMIMRENNLTKEGLEDIFKVGGYTYAEGIEQFEVMTAVNQINNFRMSSGLILSEREIKEYYDRYPMINPARYSIQRGTLPLAEGSLEELQATIARYESQISWGEPFWLDESDIAEDKSFITTLRPNQIHVEKEGGEVVVTRLVEKQESQPVPLEQRRSDIEQLIYREKSKKLFDEYKKELDDMTAIIRF